MPGENLTRREALTRSSHITVKSYDIDIDIRDAAVSPTFRTITTIHFVAAPAGDTFLDAITAQVHSVKLNGVDLDVDEVCADSRIALHGLQANNLVEVVADFSYMNTGEGLHRFVDPVDDEVYLYSQFEVPDSRRVFAVFEQPDLKATFHFVVHAPHNWQVISNQASASTLAGEDATTWDFKPTPRISSYITAVIAGPYEVIRDELVSSSGKTIPLGIFARASLFPFLDADYIFDTTKKGFVYYEEKFGHPYPFDKYDQIFAPEFNAGAMENAGAVTFAETYIFRSQVSDALRERRVVTILHELAHMWFGDLVTMRWWNDLWLNESFAEWASTLATAEATEWTGAWTTFQAMEKSWAYRQDQLPSTHPIVAKIGDIEDVQVNFDGITYAKGASVLKQLVAWVGEDAFFAGVYQYFSHHQWGNTVLTDFLGELETASGRDLAPWSKLWLETAGVNTLSLDLSVDQAGVITQAAVVQTAPEEWPTLRPHRLAVGIYASDNSGAVLRSHRVELDIDGARSDAPGLVGLHRGDFVLINDDDLAYAKIRLDSESLAFAIAHLSHIQDPLARSLVWGSVWDSTRDAEIPPQTFIDLVLGNIASESESTTVRTALGQLSLVVRNYLSPQRRTASLVKVADTLWGLLTAASPASDTQFQLLKAFSSLASTPEHISTLQGLREGAITLEGLSIDQDLQWELLAGLALAGAATQDDVNHALTLDNTSNGAQAAAKARALLPRGEDKQAVFDQLVTTNTMPNAIVSALSMHFASTNDPSVLTPFVDAYFAMLEPLWKERTYKIAEYIAEGLYPRSLIGEPLVTATKAWLASAPDIPALKRIVEENLAGVERALKVQAQDR
jgi:aminopeptidase N